MEFRISDFKTSWISGELDNDAIKFAQNFGEHLCDLQNDKGPGKLALSSSQIRNFFGEIKRIQAKGYEAKGKSSFLLIRPKLAYAEARVLQKAKVKRARISDFRSVMELAHSVVNNEQNFQNFVDFMEATLAFHKFYGGKD